jgi:hypothetical protein
MGADWLKALEIRGPTAFLAFIAATLVSLGHAHSIASLGALPEWIAAAINVVAVLFAVLSIPWLLSLAMKPFQAAKRRSSRRSAIVTQLNAMLYEEAEVFWEMVAESRRNTFANMSFLRASLPHSGLVDRGLLRIIARIGDGASLWIPDDVWEVATEDPELARKLLAIRPPRPEW